MTEVPPKAESERPEELNRRLHGKLSELLSTTGLTNDGHVFEYSVHDMPIRVSDYFFYSHRRSNLATPVEHAQAQQEALHNGTAILSVRTEDPHYADLNHFLIFRPADVNPDQNLGVTMKMTGVDMDSTEYTVWSVNRGVIAEPTAYGLVREFV